MAFHESNHTSCKINFIRPEGMVITLDDNFLSILIVLV